MYLKVRRSGAMDNFPLQPLDLLGMENGATLGIWLGCTRNLTTPEDAMEQFIQQYEKDIIGHLSGFDRLVLRGTLRSLAVKNGMVNFLWHIGVLLKDFGKLVQAKSAQLKAASLAEAQRRQRPILYLPSPQQSKEEVARKIAQKDGIQKGLIAILTAVEPCQSYEVFRNKKEKKLQLQPRVRKCLFLYHYWIDPLFGFMHGRIQSWFPFSIQICLNGREWLARQMDRLGLRYQREENCFPWIEKLPQAQALMKKQLRTNWPAVLDRIARRLNPVHEEMLAPYQEDYYWSVHQSEWATDILFKSCAALAQMYPSLVRSAISHFSSQDVMRFLGKRLNRNFQGEVVSHYGNRPEGVRLKHTVKRNSVKVYDKQGSVLRVETTINQARDFKVYRPAGKDPNEPGCWRPMRKGVADLNRRAQISQSCNERYLNGLASIRVDRPLREIVRAVCRPTHWKSQRVRALRPWSQEDGMLLRTISRGEFNLNGFRNRDIRDFLFPEESGRQDQRRLSARATYRLRMLRAHGIIRKIPRTLRYILTPKGREMITAIIHTQELSITKLMELAA
jgi:hypothetical protein